MNDLRNLIGDVLVKSKEDAELLDVLMVEMSLLDWQSELSNTEHDGGVAERYVYVFKDKNLKFYVNNFGFSEILEIEFFVESKKKWLTFKFKKLNDFLHCLRLAHLDQIDTYLNNEG